MNPDDYIIGIFDSNAPFNRIKTDPEDETQNEVDYLNEQLAASKQRLDYKIWQLQTLAEIEADLTTYGTITYEQQLQKIEVLKQYEK